MTPSLRGRRCLCAGCGHLFGSPSAFDRHQHDDGRPNPCRPVAEFVAPFGKSDTPRLVWHPRKRLWVTRLDDRDHAEDESSAISGVRAPISGVR